MNQQSNLGTLARTIIDSHMYMVLGTADESGQPWVSPVYMPPKAIRTFIGSHHQMFGTLGTSQYIRR